MEKRFDMNKKVMKPRFYLMPVVWIISLYWRIIGKTKFSKNFKSYKEPALILANHASMIDFPNVVISMFPRRVCWISSIEEFIGREWIFRHVGVYPKRKFTNDLVVVKRTADLIRKKHISVCIYPEARFSIAGVNEQLPPSLGKMAKLCKCRIIIAKQHGNYLFSPQWAKHPYRKSKVTFEANELLSKEMVEQLNEKEIQKRIEEAFVYDEYKWARDNNITTKCDKNAENLHKILYKCATCGKELSMNSKGNEIWCEACNSRWKQNPNFTLTCLTGDTRFELVSDWYRWERDEAYKEVFEGRYHFEDDCRIENLINSHVGFRNIGTVHMRHDLNGYKLEGTLDDGSKFMLEKTPLSTRSMHIEYDFKGKGDALDFATLDDSWWVYPQNKVALTKFNFTTEAIYEYVSRQANEKN